MVVIRRPKGEKQKKSSASLGAWVGFFVGAIAGSRHLTRGGHHGFLIQDMEFDELGVPGQQPDTIHIRTGATMVESSSLSSATWRTKKDGSHLRATLMT